MTANHQDLRRDLDTIRDTAAAVLRRERRRRTTMPALRAGVRVCVMTAVGLLAGSLLATVLGLPFAAMTWPLQGAIVLLPGAMLAGYLLLAANISPISADTALTTADSRHGLEDRLRTSAEFLASTERSSFMEAALLDAADHCTEIRGKQFPEQLETAGSPAAVLSWLAVALLLLGITAWIPAPEQAEVATDPQTGDHIAQLSPIAARPRQQPRDKAPEAQQPEPTRAKAPNRPQQETAPPSRRDSQLSEAEKKTQGIMGSGQSADAASASGKSQARGAPSSQAQASKSGKKSKKKQKAKKPKKAKPQEAAKQPKKPNEDSGSTAGRGAASGSNKSPSASPWESKDQVTSEDEDDLENDEEVDDEFDNSDARGGVQPHLRDRRPPVNRDLGIGFGNQKNPDANGRGGPSELKKSRGVASLVLGVPIPDHVKGRPNPGKTKITQERVEPQAENARPTDATARTPRQAPIGHVARPEMTPWMRDLVRSYFQTLRDKSRQATKDPTPAK